MKNTIKNPGFALQAFLFTLVVGLFMTFLLSWDISANNGVDNMIEATQSQQYKSPLNSDRGDFVFTSVNFRYTPQGLQYHANQEQFQRAVLMRAANGNRWVASFRMKWLEGKSLGAGLYFAYENMATHYYVGISGKEIYLIRNGRKIDKIRYQSPKNQWLRFRVRRNKNQFKVWVNNVLRLEYDENRPAKDSDTTRNPLPFGGYALGTDDETSSDTKVLFSDFMVQGNASKTSLKHAYREQVKLKDGKKNIIIWLHEQDDRASRRVKIMGRALQIMEQVSGLSYPRELSAEAVVVSHKAKYSFRKLGQTIYHDKNIILSDDKNQAFFNAIALQWDYFQELWLVGGFPLFLSGATVQKLQDKPFIFKTVPAFKNGLDKMNDPKFQDFALNGQYVGPEDIFQEIIIGKEFYAQKGALFLYMLYRDLGDKMFGQVMNRSVKNLAGKKFRRSKRMNSVDFLTAVTEIAKTHYKAYFNGWIFPGKYSRWSPAFFVDKDGDGLLLFEEKIIGTSDEKVDSDGDGYSDTWEYLNGFNPKDAKKPRVAQIAVDGFVMDWANFPNVASVLDPINDISTSYNPHDVRKLMMRADAKYLYIGIQFHNDIRLNVGKKRQRFRFRFDGKEFHSGVIDYEDSDFIAQRLKGSDLWHDYFALDQGFLIEFGLDLEMRIPIDFFNGASRIELTYAGPGELAGRKVDLQADKVNPIEVFQVTHQGQKQFINLSGLQNHFWGFGVEEISSSAHFENNRAEFVLDRRSNTYWEGKFPGDWIMIKIDKEATARNIVLDLDPNEQTQIWVELSMDKTKWKTALKETKLMAAAKTRKISLQKMDQFREKFRYIRVHMLKSSGNNGRGKIFQMNFEK